MKIWNIVLSAAHGGSDPGASANGVQEKVPNLTITLACRDYLDKYYDGHRLILPRTTDTYVSLPARRDLAARENADRYVAIHNDWFQDSVVNGFGTHLSPGPLYDTTGSFRNTVHDTIYGYVQTLGVRDRGKKFTSHWETTNVKCPALIIEYMFLSNPQGAQLLKNQQVLLNLGAYTALGIAKSLNLPLKQVQPAPWPTTRIPKILRTVGVEAYGDRTEIVGLYADNGMTYLPMLDVGEITNTKVTGHGDHIKIARW